eukprot:15469702-Alexandrium_andersonii.AAC.1
MTDELFGGPPLAARRGVPDPVAHRARPGRGGQRTGRARALPAALLLGARRPFGARGGPAWGGPPSVPCSISLCLC